MLNLRLTKSFFNGKITVIWGISSAGRAPGSQSGGQGFDPPMLHHVGMDFAPFRFFVTQKISYTLRHSSSFAKSHARLACSVVTKRKRTTLPFFGGACYPAEPLNDGATRLIETPSRRLTVANNFLRVMRLCRIFIFASIAFLRLPYRKQ